jgi:hypothetical protein
MRANKYKNKKTNGFDSKKEFNRSCELELLQKIGEISELKTQVVFDLIPKAIMNGVVIERKCTYKADFVYKDKNGLLIVEDVKGYITEVYKIKRKLMLFIYGVIIKEV